MQSCFQAEKTVHIVNFKLSFCDDILNTLYAEFLSVQHGTHKIFAFVSQFK